MRKYGYVTKHNDHDYKADGGSVVREGERRSKNKIKKDKAYNLIKRLDDSVVREGEVKRFGRKKY